MIGSRGGVTSGQRPGYRMPTERLPRLRHALSFAMALGISAVQPVFAADEQAGGDERRITLDAANVQAGVKLIGPAKGLKPGDRVTASFTVANNSRYRWVLTSLSLAAVNAKFIKIRGRGMRVRGRGTARKLTFGRIYRNKPRKFTVDLILGKTVGNHALKMTLHRIAPRPRTVSNTRRLVWRSDAAPESVVASLKPASPASAALAVTIDPNPEITVGGIRVNLTAKDAGQIKRPGAVSGMQLSIRNDGDEKQAHTALLLEPLGVKILSVRRAGKGRQATITKDGENRLVTLAGLAPGKVARLNIKVKLVPGKAKHPTVAKILNVRLLDENGDASGEPARLGWYVKNCSGSFYATLAEIRAGPVSRLSADISRAAKPLGSKPGRWVFRPSRSELGIRRRKKRRKQQAAKTGQQESAGESGPEATPVFRLANTFVKSRGADYALAKTGKLGWVTRRVSADLRNYTGQPSNPAICSGAIFMMDYFSGKLRGLERRMTMIQSRSADAFTIAGVRFQAARKAVEAATGRDPGGYDVPDGISGMRAMMAALAELADDDILAEKVRGSSDDLAALGLMRALFAPRVAKPEPKEKPITVNGVSVTAQATAETAAEDNADSAPENTAAIPAPVSRPRVLSEPELKALRGALSAIEAALYLADVRKNHDAVGSGIFGSIQTIREAHARSCNCD